MRIVTHSAGASRQLIGTNTTPAFAAARYSTGYHHAFLAITAARLPFRHPTATSRLANRFANAPASA